MDIICEKCQHYTGKSCNWGGVVLYQCELTRSLDCRSECDWHDKDFSHDKICLNCKNYLGGGDWGLSCGKNYYRLVSALDSCIKDFEAKT